MDVTLVGCDSFAAGSSGEKSQGCVAGLAESMNSVSNLTGSLPSAKPFLGDVAIALIPGFSF